VPKKYLQLHGEMMRARNPLVVHLAANKDISLRDVSGNSVRMRLTSACFYIATLEVKPRISLIERTRELALALVSRIDAQLKSLSKCQGFPKQFGEYVVDPTRIASLGFLCSHNSNSPNHKEMLRGRFLSAMPYDPQQLG
jgi:hypothetical protein